VDRYIEVTGEGRYVEIAARFVAEISVEVRAAKQETAMDEAAALWKSALATLRSAGIAEEEIVEGGTGYFHPWYWKKKVGQTASRKIILKVSEFGRLNRALEELEPLQERDRKTINVSMRQPEFATSTEAKTEALRVAYRDAHEKAKALCGEMTKRLGGVIHAEEGGWSKRASGFSGDEDWWGDSGRFGPAAGGGLFLSAAAPTAGEPEITPENPSRTIFVKCRVRFEILDS
jgi:uncharacterized protein YggE